MPTCKSEGCNNEVRMRKFKRSLSLYPEDKCGICMNTYKRYRITGPERDEYVAAGGKLKDLTVDPEARLAFVNNNASKKRFKSPRLGRSDSETSQIIKRYKTMKGCSKCGYSSNPAALHLHHIIPKNSGGSAIERSWNRLKLKKEIEKCIILCAICHAEEHYDAT